MKNAAGGRQTPTPREGEKGRKKRNDGCSVVESLPSTSTTTLPTTTTNKTNAKMARLYIGNLPMDMKEKDLEDIFYKYGKITDMQLKMPERPPAFGFVTFEDSRDADEAVRAR